MRKALIIGIDYYENTSLLSSCVKDAYSVNSVLERHGDGTINFENPKLMLAINEDNKITRRELKAAVELLFKDDSDIALFYFSGHGFIDNEIGYLVTSEGKDGHDGFSLTELLSIVNISPAKNKIVVLDCCHAGAMGKNGGDLSNQVQLSEGVTILTASRENQVAIGTPEGSIFTQLFVDALNGSAANLIGEITPGSVYAHIDQSLGPWEQRPIFRTNVKAFTSLRKVQPSITLTDLRQITELFESPGENFKLDPSFEPDSDAPDEENMRKFSILQQYNRTNLLIPVGEDHMYFAAMNSKECKLTVLGIHYWNLVNEKRL